MATAIDNSLVTEFARGYPESWSFPVIAATTPARAVYNGLVDRRPEVIVRSRTVDDTVAALELVRREGSRSLSGAAVA